MMLLILFVQEIVFIPHLISLLVGTHLVECTLSENDKVVFSSDFVVIIASLSCMCRLILRVV